VAKLRSEAYLQLCDEPAASENLCLMTDASPPVATANPLQDRERRWAMIIVFLVVFIDLLGFGVVLPLAPRYVKDYLNWTTDTTIRGLIIGAIYSSFSLMQFFFSPMWGRLSDRIGRRPILILSLVGSVVFYALFGFAATLPSDAAFLALALLLVSRVGAGIAGASVSTAAAVIADCTTPEKRAKGMALIGAAFGFGFTFGPLLAYLGMYTFDDARWGPGAIASILSAVALVLAIIFMPETVKHSSHRAGREWFSASRTMEVLRMPSVGPLVLIYFLVIFAFANFEGTLALFTAEAFRMTDRENFLVFAFVGFVLMIAQGGVYRPLVGIWSEELLMKLGVALLLIGMGGLATVAYGSHMLQPSGGGAGVGLHPMFYLAMTISIFGFAFVNPSVSALVSRNSDPTRQGEILGVNQSFAALGRILGPSLGVFAFEKHPSRILPYAMAAVTLLIVLAIFGSKPSPPSSASQSE
jgi:MFS transporter, DHA1 family, tetracycline resistance protein